MARLENGFIKIHRKIMNWQWYKDKSVPRVFLHLLLRASYEVYTLNGVELKAGQLVTTLQELRSELALDKKTILRSLVALEQTGEITREIINKHTFITINNYDIYQVSNDNNDGGKIPPIEVEKFHHDGGKIPPIEAEKFHHDGGKIPPHTIYKKEKEEKRSIKKREAPPALPEITDDFLNDHFGEQNVTLYRSKFRRWAKGKRGLCENDVIYKWMTEDNVVNQSNTERQADSSDCSFDITDFDINILEEYD